jgi:DNA replication and repair protein RecF
MSRKIHIERLTLKEFRNYSNLDIFFSDKINVITGKNGIGKTNIVEAISLHLPGRGLRGEKIINFDNFNQDEKYKVFWHINSIVHTKLGQREFELSRSGDFESSKSERIIKIDGKLIKNKKALAELSSIIWLTPRMDQIFITASSERRKFFDKIAINYNSQHNENLSRFEDLMRERIKILEDNYSDEIWLSSIEKTMAELATSIFFTREDAVGYINSAMINLNEQFVKKNSKQIKRDGIEKYENLMFAKIEE